MGGRIGLAAVFLVLSIHAASSASAITLSNITSVASTIITQSNNPTSSSSSSVQESSATPASQGFLSATPASQGFLSATPASQGFLSPKPPSSYQVTENVIDIPDDRPKPSIVPTFSLFKPLNFANTNITINKFTKNDTGDENHQPKKTTITYVHITKETNEWGIKKFFKGIRDYVYGLKRGVIDSLHKHIHKDDRHYEKFPKSVHGDEEDDFPDEFHKHLHSVESFGDYGQEFDHKLEFEE